jgi:transcriptional regulatory protein LevR
MNATIFMNLGYHIHEIISRVQRNKSHILPELEASYASGYR